MTFLNPVALWGLSFILIPIIIHLFNFRKVKKLYFSNVSFLTSVKNRSSSNNTLRKLLILLLRVLAIVFLVLAFAQPILPTDDKDLVQSSEVYYLDNSLSMGRLSVINNDLLTDAMSLLEARVSVHGDNYSFGLTTNDLNKYNRPLLTRELTDQFSELTLSIKTQKFENVYAKMNRIDPNASRYIVLSDFQTHAFSGMSSILDDTSKSFLLLKLDAVATSNLYVDSVAMDNPIGLPDENILKIGVKNIGETNRQEVLVKVFKDNTQISSFTQNFESNTTTWLNIDLSKTTNVSGSYTLEIADNEFVHDNLFHFVIETFSKPKVIQIFDENPNNYISSVYANDEYFDLRKASVNSIDQDQLMNADLVVLDHLAIIPDWLINQLFDFDRSILVFPNESVEEESYRSFLGRSIKISSDTIKQKVSITSLKHPVFTAVFNKIVDKAELPWVRPRYDINNVSDNILKSSLGKPILAEIRPHVYFFSSPLTNDFTNLSRKGLFVPLMYKLSMTHRQNSIASYSIQDKFVPLTNDSLYLNGNLRLISSDLVLVPVLRNINGDLSLEIPSVMTEPGFYKLVSNQDTLKTIAFNLPKEESDLRSINKEEILNMLNGYDNVKFELVEDVSVLSEKLASANQSQPLWKYALLLALLFLIIELTLLRIFR